MEDFDSTNTDTQSFLDRVKESPRTVSALIIILIVAAAVYAFSGEEQTGNLVDEGVVTEDTVQIAEGEVAEGELVAGEEGDQEDATASAEGESVTREAVSQEEMSAQSQALPEASRNEQGYQETAQAGDGITHLARRATTRWLSENQPGYSVTNEHRIYIEDYVQNRMGTQGISVGENMTVSYDLIAEAVAAAGQLSDGQLQNLSQYTVSLS